MPNAPQITIVLESDAKGGLKVLGPFDNAVLFLGMLELAKQALFDYRQNIGGGSKVIVPQPVIDPGKLKQ